MNTHNTIEKMTAMRMKAMAAVYHQAVTQHLYSEMGQDEFTALMIDQEWEDRQHRRIQRMMANARFQQQASARDLDFRGARPRTRLLAVDGALRDGRPAVRRGGRARPVGGGDGAAAVVGPPCQDRDGCRTHGRSRCRSCRR